MSTETTDIVLIGGGIMSATLAHLLQRLRPDWSIMLFERANDVATESSGAWNNAGTGHAGLCELNYTPRMPDGTISTNKALMVNSQFQQSLRFWANLVEQGALQEPSRFIRPVPHISYVSGENDVRFLRDRYDALSVTSAFETMTYSDDPDQLAAWTPLMFQGRTVQGPIAMTRNPAGTDVNFGELTKQLVASAVANGLQLHTLHTVTDLKRTRSGWWVTVKDHANHRTRTVDSRFVFVGAGGAAVHLLQKAGYPEAKGYGGFPVSGQFLRCTNPELIKAHDAKVYGQPQLNAPPMSMPHLDTRVIDGERVLLFGPFAGFSPRFLKAGKLLDLPLSIKPGNLTTYIDVGRSEFGLTMYLVKQVLLRHGQRIDVLRDFVPLAKDDEWTLYNAGMRVQTLKRAPDGHGRLEFGTEVVATADGSIAGLLGASPGASTAVSIMLQLIQNCFPNEDLSQLGELLPSLDGAPDGQSNDDLQRMRGILHLDVATSA